MFYNKKKQPQERPMVAKIHNYINLKLQQQQLNIKIVMIFYEENCLTHTQLF